MMSWCFSVLNTFFTLYYWKLLLPSTSSTSLAHWIPNFHCHQDILLLAHILFLNSLHATWSVFAVFPSIHHNAACSKFGLARSCHTNLPVFTSTCPSHTLYNFPVHSSAFSSVHINCFYISNFLSINSPTTSTTGSSNNHCHTFTLLCINLHLTPSACILPLYLADILCI